MRKKKKIAFGFFIGLITFLILAYISAWLIAPGSYAKAEIYNFNMPEDSLLKIIYKVKDENPDLNLNQEVRTPNGDYFELEEGRSDSKDYWHSIYFYYPDKNEIIFTWTRPKTKSSTSFAFVSINSGLTVGNWRTVNDSFWWWKNEPDKEEFEERILKKIIDKTKAQQRITPIGVDWLNELEFPQQSPLPH
ncbi:hypothetical protein MG296_14215 [Flavobacteriaceae bacterium TK19130]|nr:hypothetical protein [Thermobacterium salinum]